MLNLALTPVLCHAFRRHIYPCLIFTSRPLKQLLRLENVFLLANRFLNTLPALLCFPLWCKIPTYANVVELAIQLLGVCQTLRVQNSIINRLFHRTAGFRIVAAVSKTAIYGELTDFIENAIESIRLPELKLPYTRRVDKYSTGRQREQPPMRGGVAAPVIARTDFQGRLNFGIEQAIHECGLPNPRGTQQDCGVARAKITDGVPRCRLRSGH